MHNIESIHNTELPAKPHRDILCHVYRSVDGKPDMEGMLVPFALALLLRFQFDQCEGNWEAPNIIFGAHLSEISNGIALYDIYADQFRKELEFLGLPANCCTIYTPDMFDRKPIDTLSELTAFEYYRWIMYPEERPTAMCFSREPHQERIKYLCKQHDIKTDFLSAEEVIREILSIEGTSKKETMEKYFPDTDTFQNAESIKMAVMLLLDKKGRGLEFISNFHTLKNWLLNAGGHKS